MMSGYSEGKRCPVCGVGITDKARFCREHTQAFARWLRWLYGRSVIFSKQNPGGGPGSGARARGARTRRRIVEVLRRQGPLSTPELGRAMGMTAVGVNHGAKRLEREGKVTGRKDGCKTIWALEGGLDIGD